MLLWFVSALLTLAYDFPYIELIDLEIDAAGTVWLLPLSDPAVIRLESGGSQSRFETGVAGLPSGITVSPTGRWAISFQSPGALCRFDRDDVLVEKMDISSSGDVLFSGLTTWTIDNASSCVVSTDGEVIARNCADINSRFSSIRAGQVIVSGPAGVFLIEAGEIPERIAFHGSACFSREGIMLLKDGVLQMFQGEIILTDVPWSRISASPDGETVILWGNAAPMVLE
ncbi:MAG: hypothetical protein U9P42_04855 [Candidatus Fermentibacteria bacterium]|nr:hypothetical protein [Candidatus Fermentibacteria bacterium]